MPLVALSGSLIPEPEPRVITPVAVSFALDRRYFASVCVVMSNEVKYPAEA